MTPDLDDLRTFTAVAEGRSFAAAAVRLALSPSMVSRRIAGLERLLGTRLLHRTTRGMHLTAAGARFHERCCVLLRALDDACDDARDGDAPSAGPVRLTAPYSLGAPLVAPVVAELLRRHPGLQFDLVLDDGRRDLVREGIDLAVRAGALSDSTCVARRLATLRGHLVASPAYLAQHGTPRDIADLAAHRLLEHSVMSPGSCWPAVVQAGRRVRANGFDALLALALHGAGVALLPPLTGLREIERGELVTLLPHAPSPGVDLWALAPPAPRLPARTRRVLEALAAYASRPVGEWGRPATG